MSLYNRLKNNWNKMYKIGHRGASACELENTFKAFEKAIELGANMIELDVRLSKDGHLIVMHDQKIDRTTNGKGFVRDLTLDELRKFQTLNNEKIPTLQEIIESMKGRCDLYIELKEEGCEQKIVDIIQKNSLHDNVIVISFIHPSLKRIKELDPRIRTSALIRSVHICITKIVDNANADFAHLCWESIPNKIELLKKYMQEKKSIGIITWHEEDPRIIEELIKLEVDGICSYKPDLLK